jgi:lipopolysaccharide export system protein LptA
MFQVNRLLYPLISFILLFCPLSSFALDSDNKERVNVEADSVIYNYKTGVDVYEGNVKVNQGTTHITADRLVTKSNKEHRIKEAAAFGLQTLAHYWTLPKMGDPEVHAYAKVIKFYPLESNVTLEQEVRVTQGENVFQGELIHYNSNDQTITVPALKNGRAVIVYNPEK